MSDPVRVSVESNDEEETARIHDNTGEVDAGDATFRFTINGGFTRSDTETRVETEDSERADKPAPRYIGPLTEIPSNSTLRCEAMNGRRGTGIILRRENGDVFAWRNSCPHEPNVPLDPGGGAIVDDDQLVCHEHGARFERGDGLCTYGPCRGDVLDEIDVEVRDGDVYLSDERFNACNRFD